MRRKDSEIILITKVAAFLLAAGDYSRENFNDEAGKNGGDWCDEQMS